MTEPYIKANPGDPILSENWNTMQVRMIEALRTHTHLGADDGKKLGGNSIDPDTTLRVSQLEATSTLTVKGLNVFDRISGLGNEKLSVTGGTVSGTLTVSGGMGIGATTTPKAKLDIQEVARTGTHPASVRGLYVTGNFGADSDGVEFRHTNGTQGIGIGYNTLYATGTSADQDLGLKARGNGKVSVQGGLKVQGAIIPSTGNAATAGIQFPSDPGGGGGDQAFMRYYASSGETTKLLIGIENDVDDTIGLWQMGAERLTIYNGSVGIGTATPQTKLEIKGATSDSSASALRVTNSGGSALFEVRNDGAISLFDKQIYLRGMGDTNHGIAFDSSVDGPRVFGNLGGQLTTTVGNKVALRWEGSNVTVRGDLYAGNSAIYFTQTAHDHSGIGNTSGYAAIENASNYGALMILGRQTDKGRIVKLWDRLEVNGKIWTTDGRFEGSDLRLKRDIVPLEGSLEKVLKLRATSFRMVESQDPSPRIGLIAQEVEQVFPEVVEEGPDGMKGISYSRLIAPLIEAIKSQQQQIDGLRAALRATTKENHG